ncbi:MAG: hypothetical protein AAGH78_10665 [Cyanobacteria bacterium P01_H01_bin.58]
MTVIICPGMHPKTWTDSFLAQLDAVYPAQASDRVVFNHSSGMQWSAYALRAYLTAYAITPPIILIAFSAGCIAASGMAQYWEQRGYPIAGLIAVDGWGAPTVGKFRAYRLSHDAFTHDSSAWLGRGEVSFYADPSVAHAQLWRYPAAVWGQQMGDFNSPGGDMRMQATALQFLHNCLQYLQALETVDSKDVKNQ